MANIQTVDIEVIPAVRKSQDISRLTSEETLTNIVRSIGPNRGCFLITNQYDAETIEFCIEGYYVKVAKSKLPTNSGDVWAQCNYAITSSIKELQGEQVVQGQTNNTYLGISFYTTSPNGTSLKILENGNVNVALSFETLLSANVSAAYRPFITASAAPTDTNKIWIDTTNNYNLLKVYNGNNWISIGAVAK